MATGTVKWFNDAKGYGFIRADEEPGDIFVHYSSVEAEGFRSLNEGDSVEFDLIKSDKGLKAEKVSRMEV